MAEAWRVLVQGGVVVPGDPGPTPVFLRASPPGAYTSTRTTYGASRVLFWERHLARLCDSLARMEITVPSNVSHNCKWDSILESLIQPSLQAGLHKALQLRKAEEEVTITVLVCGTHANEMRKEERQCDVYVHLSNYKEVPGALVDEAIRVAVMGPGRSTAQAKFSLWASIRQGLEKVKPQGIGEIILSNDGLSLLEGMTTNLFVVVVRDQELRDGGDDVEKQVQVYESGRDWSHIEVQTAPLNDGVLPGVIRGLVIESCRDIGIPVREVSPYWANRQRWCEAFLTNSLRIIQPIAAIQMAVPWSLDFRADMVESAVWDSWSFTALGFVTLEIKRAVLERFKGESTTVEDVLNLKR